MRLLPAARAALATVALCAAPAGCAALRAADAVRATAPGTSAPAAAASPGPAAGVVSQVPGTSPALTQTGGGTYLSWDAAPRTVLGRIDTRTGQIGATNTFSRGRLGTPLSADGSLWVTDSGSLGELLLRLDPATLMLTGELALSAARYPGGSHLAYAGGWLWADGGGRLLRVSPSLVELTAAIPLGGRSSDVGASPDGSVLIVTEQANKANSGAVERRDPRTGALLAASPIAGADAAVIDGFTGSAVWVTETAGVSGFAQRLSLRSMRPGAARPVSGRGDISVRVAHGLLWVTGGTARGYCASARTGRALAALPVTGHGVLLAVGAGVLYYAEPAPHGTGTRIVPVPVPAGCG